MATDLISDTLTRVRNAQRAGHKVVEVQEAKAVRAFLEVLKKEGFIQSFVERDVEGKTFKKLEVTLRYYSNGQPVVSTARRYSKPGRRVYAGVKDLPRINSGLGIVIVSTAKGVVSDREARVLGMGGELLATIS